MLILTRRPAETIYIGEQVTVTVLGVVGNQVRFGIEAPRSITIDRAEIHERKKRAALGQNGGNAVDSNPPEEPEEINGNLADAPLASSMNGAVNGVMNGTAPTLKLRR